jgi:flagellar M-ring protein FliF
MSFLRSFLDQLKELQNQSSTASKIGIGVTAAFCVALIIGVGIWSSQPNYVPLAQNLEPAQAAEIMSKLTTSGIKNKSNYTTILVDKSQWDRANMLVADLIPDAQRAPKEFESSTFRDPKLNEFYQQEHLEKKLSAAISRFKSIDSAVVHLNIAKDQNFMRSSEPSSASVVLTLRPRVLFSAKQTAAIVAMVSSSVKGLSPDNVKVVDINGNLLSGGESHLGSIVGEQYEMRRRMEADLSNQAEWVLERRLGPGKAVVRVSADVDFTELTTVETTHPESLSKISEKTKKSVTKDEAVAAIGPAGTSANIGSSRGFNQGKPVISETEDSEIEFAQGEVTSTRQEAPGKIRRLTIAAMVDLTPPKPVAVDNADGTTTPAAPAVVDPLTLTDIEELIKAAVGFDVDRYDEIKVVQTTLAAELPLELLDEPQDQPFAAYEQIARNASLGIAALLAALIGFFLLRKIRPMTIVKESELKISPERARRLSEMATLAKQHPEAMASIVAAWINEPKTDGEHARGERARAA